MGIPEAPKSPKVMRSYGILQAPKYYYLIYLEPHGVLRYMNDMDKEENDLIATRKRMEESEETVAKMSQDASRLMLQIVMRSLGSWKLGGLKTASDSDRHLNIGVLRLGSEIC